MWLSEQAVRPQEATSVGALGVVTIGGASCAVVSGSETRDVPVACPGGMVWLPEGEREVVTLQCDNGTPVVLGVVGTAPPAEMAPGDVYLYTRNTAILLKNNGEIYLRGRVTVEGSLTVVETTGGTDDGAEAD